MKVACGQQYSGENNSNGFRDREFDIRKGKGTYRIICLGDSVTFGAPEDKVRIEQVYTERLGVLTQFIIL